METVKLKNGSEEAKSLIISTMLSLDKLLGAWPIAFYDLVMRCHDRDYEWFGNNRQVCIDLSFARPDGNIHDSIKNIILSAVVGDDLDMRLVSPVAETKEAPDAHSTV